MKKKDKIILEKGGFIISGLISKTVKDKETGVISRLNYSELTFLLPNEGEYVCRENTLLFKFTIDVIMVTPDPQIQSMLPPLSPHRTLILDSNSGNNLINIIEDDENVILSFFILFRWTKFTILKTIMS